MRKTKTPDKTIEWFLNATMAELDEYGIGTNAASLRRGSMTPTRRLVSRISERTGIDEIELFTTIRRLVLDRLRRESLMLGIEK
jgi:hypothetical protein